MRLKCSRGQGLQGEYCLSPFSLFKHAEVICILLLSLHSLLGFFSCCLQVRASPAMLPAGFRTGSHIITRRPKWPLAGEDCALVNPQRIQVFFKLYPRNLRRDLWVTLNPQKTRESGIEETISLLEQEQSERDGSEKTELLPDR